MLSVAAAECRTRTESSRSNGCANVGIVPESIAVFVSCRLYIKVEKEKVVSKALVSGEF